MADEQPLEHMPETEEGDDSEAGGGEPAVPTTEAELEDAAELDEDEE